MTRSVVTVVNVRPLIGISTYARAGERPCFSVPCTYVDAVVAAGGIPVLLPPVACAATVLEGLGGLLLPGGGDVTHCAAQALFPGLHGEPSGSPT